jgi:hypothetical protein
MICGYYAFYPIVMRLGMDWSRMMEGCSNFYDDVESAIMGTGISGILQ